ncbi:MAG TPA: ABC transporter substrate-binding protein [Candidatus Limnocylindria bacterium]|nr:ABC transporter substrate-binding protein [Candidatus Limnocylindria bacterium]
MGRPARSWMAVAIALALIVSACQQQPRTGTATSAPTGTGGEQPKSGGTLVFIVSSEPPSFDAHRETTYALLHPTSPHYSLLYKFDPAGITKNPKIVPDVAADMPQVSADKLTWTIKLRTNVKFHDGSQMTSADVLATYNKIIFPEEAKGVLSPRKGVYAAVESIAAPDPNTVVFKLKYPSGSFQSGLASPWNWIYSAAKLKEDPRWYEKNVMGTGPFTRIEYVKGSHWSGRKNPDYFVQGRPYLDAYRAVFIADANAQKNAIQSGQAQIEFRGFTPQQRDDLSRAMGTNLAVQENSWVCVNYITFNTTKKPFDDVRVRRALTLAIDRWSGGQALSQITIVKDVGGLSRPGSTYAMPPAELQKIAGFGRDAKTAQDQAKALLAQAGVPNLTFAFHNRSVTTPYEPVAVFAINEWKKIGVNATHQVKETSAYIADLRNKNFDVGLDFNCDYLDEPDLQLSKFYSASGLGRGLNLAHYDDKKLDDMITAQSRETDVEKRKKLVWDIEKYAMDEMAYQVPVLWWYRIIPHSTKVRGWEIGSNHYTNQDLASVWLAN